MARTIMTRLTHGGDLVPELERLAAQHGLTRGTVQVIGALKGAMLGFYQQEEKRYQIQAVSCPVEILSGLGNISLRDGRAMVHLHLVISGEDGHCLGGHAMRDCIIYAAEAVLTEVEGPPLVRTLDETTGLSLWDMDTV